jgi:hypothetical protein
LDEGEGLGLRALRQQMNVGGIEQRVQRSLWLQRQKGDIGAPGEPPLEPWSRRTRTAQDHADLRVGTQLLGHLGEHLEPLLFAHAAGVQRDHLMLGHAQLAAQDAGRRKRPDRIGVHPVREEAQTTLGHAEAPQPSARADADGRNQIEATDQPAIGAAQQAPQPRRPHHAEPACRLHFQVLDMQTRARAA